METESYSLLAAKVLPGHEFYDKLNDERIEKEEIFHLKMNYARTLVSLWSYASMADGVFHKKEGSLVGMMVNALFEEGCIFYPYIANKEKIVNEITTIFENPLPIKTIKSFTKDNPVMALNFFEDAACIVYSDGKLSKKEKEFLDDLSKELDISAMDKKNVEKKFLKS